MALGLFNPNYLDKIKEISYLTIPKNEFEDLLLNQNINTFIDEYYWHLVTINGLNYYVKNGKKRYQIQKGNKYLLPDDPLPSNLTEHITYIDAKTPRPVNYASYINKPDTPDTPSPTCFKGNECSIMGGKIKKWRKSKKWIKIKRRKSKRKKSKRKY